MMSALKQSKVLYNNVILLSLISNLLFRDNNDLCELNYPSKTIRNFVVSALLRIILKMTWALDPFPFLFHGRYPFDYTPSVIVT